MKLYLLFVLALTLFAAACKKDETELEKLPNATQTGSGDAGFLLDGRAWLPQASNLIGTGGAVGASWRRTVAGRTLRVGFGRDSDGTSAGFFVPNIRQAGTFTFTQRASLTLGDRNPAYGSYIMSKPVPDRVFLTGPTATGTLIVSRFDTVARIASGTFELTVQEETTPETHQLTDGRFDVQF